MKHVLLPASRRMVSGMPSLMRRDGQGPRERTRNSEQERVGREEYLPDGCAHRDHSEDMGRVNVVESFLRHEQVSAASGCPPQGGAKLCILVLHWQL